MQIAWRFTGTNDILSLMLMVGKTREILGRDLKVNTTLLLHQQVLAISRFASPRPLLNTSNMQLCGFGIRKLGMEDGHLNQMLAKRNLLRTTISHSHCLINSSGRKTSALSVFSKRSTPELGPNKAPSALDQRMHFTRRIKISWKVTHVYSGCDIGHGVCWPPFCRRHP